MARTWGTAPLKRNSLHNFVHHARVFETAGLGRTEQIPRLIFDESALWILAVHTGGELRAKTMDELHCARLFREHGAEAVLTARWAGSVNGLALGID